MKQRLLPVSRDLKYQSLGFVFGSRLVAQNNIDEKQGVARMDWNNRVQVLGFKTFQLSVTVKCEMDFQKFPFDEHVCNLEVSSILSL